MVPPELTRGPFTLQDARRHGVTEDQLRGSNWRHVTRGVFAWHAIADQPLVRLRATLSRLPAGAAFCGSTAGWLHGLDLEPCNPIEAIVPSTSGVTRRAGIAIRRGVAFEMSAARGLPATSRVRTVVDLVRARELVDAVSVLDMALHRRIVSVIQIQRWADGHHGRRGVSNLRRALVLADPATESPMETRLRVLLVLAGLPRPRVQQSLYDDARRFTGRPDLYYPLHRLAIEYDGGNHRGRLVSDNRRQNRLLAEGCQILRFTAADVLGDPAAVVALVRRALARPSEPLAGIHRPPRSSVR